VSREHTARIALLMLIVSAAFGAALTSLGFVIWMPLAVIGAAFATGFAPPSVAAAVRHRRRSFTALGVQLLLVRGSGGAWTDAFAGVVVAPNVLGLSGASRHLASLTYVDLNQAAILTVATFIGAARLRASASDGERWWRRGLLLPFLFVGGVGLMRVSPDGLVATPEVVLRPLLPFARWSSCFRQSSRSAIWDPTMPHGHAGWWLQPLRLCCSPSRSS